MSAQIVRCDGNDSTHFVVCVGGNRGKENIGRYQTVSHVTNNAPLAAFVPKCLRCRDRFESVIATHAAPKAPNRRPERPKLDLLTSTDEAAVLAQSSLIC